MLFTDSIKSMQTKHTVTSSDRKIWFGAYVWQILSIINKELRIELEILLTTHAFWHMFGRGYEQKNTFMVLFSVVIQFGVKLMFVRIGLE